ncbi:S8 family serine peptidase [Natronomonas salina]|nr:S8 family serine peptidase [Natronomonas salina]
MINTTPNRRDLLRGIAGGGLTVAVTGIASADGETRYLVQRSDPAAESNLGRRGFSVERSMADGEVLVVTGTDSASDELEGTDGVEVAIPDFSFELSRPELSEPKSTDSDGSKEDSGYPAYYDSQWDKHVTDVETAHESATGDGTTIAILDTGIDHTHPDLYVNETASAAFIGGEVHDHTGDVHGHGTHVGGIAAATGEVGVVGTAPDAELVSLRVFPSEDEEQDNFWSDLLRAIEYAAVDLGADSLNMSIGTVETLDGGANAGGIRGVTEPVMQHAARRGTVVVGSAGNHGESLQQEGRWTLPNSLAGVVSVSATGPSDELTFYSNWGTNEIDLGAPGGGYETLEKTLEDDTVEWPYPTNLVLSTFPKDLDDSGYAYLAGTSMSAPQVTGAVAAVRELAPGANANEVERALEAGADLVEGKGDAELGAGRLNVANALDEV